MAIRTHGGHAFTSAPEGWELHPHENQVVQTAGTAPAVCLLIPWLHRQFRANGSHAFFKERGIVETRYRCNYAATGAVHLDAMTEYFALAENG